MSVTYTIHPPKGEEKTVSVDFTDNTISYTRTVNAVFTKGLYDVELTNIRVSEVAKGVENKILLGMISNTET
jgi:hypothetical protein